MTNLSLGCCVYISLSQCQLIHVLKAVTIATSEHLNLLTIFVVIVTFWMLLMVSSEWRLITQVFWLRKSVPFSWIELSLIEVTNKTLLQAWASPDEWSCPLNRGIKKERFYCRRNVWKISCDLSFIASNLFYAWKNLHQNNTRQWESILTKSHRMLQ